MTRRKILSRSIGKNAYSREKHDLVTLTVDIPRALNERLGVYMRGLGITKRSIIEQLILKKMCEIDEKNA